MKMDHHCPWINNCCGHLNHAYFTSFLLLAPMACAHAAIIFIMTMYTQLYERVSRLPHHTPCFWMAHYHHSFHHLIRMLTHVKLFSFPSLQISFGWSTVKIDMSAVRRFQPLMPFSMPAFAATLFALGLALGTTIAVGMLFFIQVHFSSGFTIYTSCWWFNVAVSALTLQSQPSIILKWSVLFRWKWSYGIRPRSSPGSRKR